MALSYPFSLSSNLLQIFLDIQQCCSPDNKICNKRECKDKTPADCKDNAVVEDMCPVLCKKCPAGNNIFLKKSFC